MRTLHFFAAAFVAITCSGCSGDRDSSVASTDSAIPQPTTNEGARAMDEAQLRKQRSIQILKSENVPYLEALPPIETEVDSTRRSTIDVASRALALCIVAVKGEGLEQELVLQLIKQHQLDFAFSPKEREFIYDANPTQEELNTFKWRYESYWVMLWALGFVDELERPQQICDALVAWRFLRDNGREGFTNKAELRPQSELLDAADMIYRYDWATVEARLRNEPMPAGLDNDVIMERHHALNWLIGHKDQEWDHVTLDT